MYKTAQDSDQIQEFGDSDDAIWNYGKGFVKVYTENYETKKRLMKIRGAKLMCLYALPNGQGMKRAWDFVMLSKRRNTAIRILKKPKG